MQYIPEPSGQLNDAYLRDLLDEVAIDGMSLTSNDAVMTFLNAVYSAAERRLSSIIHCRDALSLIRLGYMEVERWTWVFREDMTPFDIVVPDVPKELCSFGRYGWRYVIEVCLPRVAKERVIRPEASQADMDCIFTMLAIMGLTSEYSNLIRYFGREFALRIKYSKHDPVSWIPDFDEECAEKYRIWSSYLMAKPRWREYPQFYPKLDSGWFPKLLDQAFLDEFGFRLSSMLPIVSNWFGEHCTASIAVFRLSHGMDCRFVHCIYRRSSVNYAVCIAL